jgi:hypothetical protein
MKGVTHPEPLKHIEGLIPGDKVKLIIPGHLTEPSLGDVLIVATVLEKIKSEGDFGCQICRNDFTAHLLTSENKNLEFYFDSRYFERVE